MSEEAAYSVNGSSWPTARSVFSLPLPSHPCSYLEEGTGMMHRLGNATALAVEATMSHVRLDPDSAWIESILILLILLCAAFLVACVCLAVQVSHSGRDNACLRRRDDEREEEMVKLKEFVRTFLDVEKMQAEVERGFVSGGVQEIRYDYSTVWNYTPTRTNFPQPQVQVRKQVVKFAEDYVENVESESDYSFVKPLPISPETSYLQQQKKKPRDSLALSRKRLGTRNQ